MHNFKTCYICKFDKNSEDFSAAIYHIENCLYKKYDIILNQYDIDISNIKKNCDIKYQLLYEQNIILKKKFISLEELCSKCIHNNNLSW